MSDAAKSFNILATSLSVLYNSDSLTKLFLDLYLVKIHRYFIKTVLSMHNFCLQND